jgi:N-methylhydantoinase A
MTKVCIDVGGTFTDCLVLGDDGRLAEFKAATTPTDASQSFIDVLERAARASGQTLGEFVTRIDCIVHGTTLATNALLTGKGARVGMLTTRGFRDQIEARRGQKNIRTSMYNLFVPPYRPLVPRSRRLGVTERLMYDGSVAMPLDEADARAAIEHLAQDEVESIAICFLHSYANGAHEARVEDLCLQRLDGNVYVTSSHQVVPIWGEYERFSTTVVGAFVGPIVSRYLARLEERLGELGFGGSLFVVQSDGLMQSAGASRQRAVGLVNSGPAAAPISAVHAGRSVGVDNLISMDMGGTSFDVCLLENGRIPTTSEGWVGDERITTKMIDNLTVGAGGGSIVWIDEFGLLRVGPRSAGADPGPAAYGRGGREPTVTDADLILGYVPYDYFLGGEIELDQSKAEEALRTVSTPLNIDVVAAAEAVFRSVNSYMADQITEISTRRGLDIRDFALVVGGGAGPVHAASIARVLGIRKIVIPRHSALYSAYGMFNMDIGREYVRSYLASASDVDLERISQLFAAMEAEATGDMQASHLAPEELSFTRTAEMRYAGQYHSVEVPLDAVPTTADDIERAVAAFEARHRELYTFDLPFRGVEFMLLRLRATADTIPPRDLAFERAQLDAARALKRYRKCYFDVQWRNTPCYDGDALEAGNTLPGPAIVEEKTTTLVIPAGFTCAIEWNGTYVLEQEIG